MNLYLYIDIIDAVIMDGEGILFMDTVSVLKCGAYEYKLVKQAIEQSFDNLGGIGTFIKPGDKVLLKLNLLMRKNPDDAVTTHSVFAKALAETVMEAGGIVTIADSPGGLYNETVLKSVYKGCKIEEIANELGVRLNYDTSFETVPFPEGKTVKSFPIIKPILDADVVITVPKLKTHMMTFYSGAVKNMFGAVPGIYKAEYHFSLPQKEDFCSMLVDLCQLTRPTLAIMDAVWGMEGEGPSGGIKKHIGAVLASANPYALDLAATALVGITPDEAPTIAESIARGLCPASVEGLRLVGDDFEAMKIHDLVKPPLGTPDFLDRKWIPKRLSHALNAYLAPIPRFDTQICVGCGECMRRCPAKAIEMKDGYPQLTKQKCIHCFCCQELCPKKAIVSKRSALMKFVLKH